jgi:hypothetical protein
LQSIEIHSTLTPILSVQTRTCLICENTMLMPLPAHRGAAGKFGVDVIHGDGRAATAPVLLAAQGEQGAVKSMSSISN